MNTDNELLSKLINSVHAEQNRLQSQGIHFAERADKVGINSAAAACYAIHSAHTLSTGASLDGTPIWWPLDKQHWSPATPRENLVTAIVLLMNTVQEMDVADAKVQAEAVAKNTPENSPQPPVTGA
jgi:hypothetical protein